MSDPRTDLGGALRQIHGTPALVAAATDALALLYADREELREHLRETYYAAAEREEWQQRAIKRLEMALTNAGFPLPESSNQVQTRD